jgi:hypothetical protein
VGPLARSILGIMTDLTERLPSELYLCELDEKRRKEIRGEAGTSRSCSLFNTLLHKIMHNLPWFVASTSIVLSNDPISTTRMDFGDLGDPQPMQEIPEEERI